jgi:hypothetical protein
LGKVSEPKPFASLSSGLLARKGAARPAMRPQGFGQAGQSLEDLGWDDMGFDPPKPTEVGRDASHDAFGDDLADHMRVHPTGLTPVHSPVHSQQAEIAARVAAPELAEEQEFENDYAEPEAEFDAQPEPPVQAAPLVQVKAVKVLAPVVVAPAAVAPSPAAYPQRARQQRAAPGSKAKAAFTLRLEPERHLKLRLACALDGRSAQHIVTEALDQLLAQMPELSAMTATAKQKG